MLDRDKVINWWIGRFSDPELGEWTGMAPRAVGLVLNIPFMRAGVSGGGRGSRHNRRIAPRTRNAIAIVHALSETGLPLELATNIIAATPMLASVMTQSVDVSDLRCGVRSLGLTEPQASWLPTDIVPEHVWGRYVYPCIPVDQVNPLTSDAVEVEQQNFVPNTDRGTMLINGDTEKTPSVELRALTDHPVYAGEIDQRKIYNYWAWWPKHLADCDHHLLIVNARWVVLKSPETQDDGTTRFQFYALSTIEPDRKTVRVIGWGNDEPEQERALYYLKNYDSLLDINITLAVRKMKRRALGLPVGPPDKPQTWAERVRIAQRYPAPEVAKIDVAAEIAKMDEFFGVWTTDPKGNRVRVGLSKEETEEYDAIERRDQVGREGGDAFPWASVDEKIAEGDRYEELLRKHNRARQAKILEDMKVRPAAS